MDQLSKMRDKRRSAWRTPEPPLRSAGQPYIWAIGSGKGGVGKTTLAACLALRLAARGWTTLLVDGDLNLPNLHCLFERAQAVPADAFVFGKKTLAEIVCPASERLDVFAPTEISSTLGDYTEVFLEKIVSAARCVYDVVLIDLANSFSALHHKACQVADEISVVLTPEPATIINGYAFVKLARRSNAKLCLSLIHNRVDPARDPESTVDQFNRIAGHFLKEKFACRGMFARDAKLDLYWQESIPVTRWDALQGEVRAIGTALDRFIVDQKQAVFSVRRPSKTAEPCQEKRV